MFELLGESEFAELLDRGTSGWLHALTFGKSTTPVVLDKTFQLVDNESGKKALLRRFFHGVPIKVVGDAVAEIKENSTSVCEQVALVVENAIHARAYKWCLCLRA